MASDSLSLSDIGALAFFVAVWVAFSNATSGRLTTRLSLTQLMNSQRENWMRAMARREMRMVDTSIMIGLQQGTAFFASSALIALGGCFALMQASDEVMTFLAFVPGSAPPSRAVYEAKVLGLMVVLAYTFFKFGWAYRLFNYSSILVGAVPASHEADGEALDRAAARAARMNVIAGRHFNAGLRAMFFSIAYLGWFVGPVALAASTVFILFVLVRRQFFSHARATLLDPP